MQCGSVLRNKTAWRLGRLWSCCPGGGGQRLHCREKHNWLPQLLVFYFLPSANKGAALQAVPASVGGILFWWHCFLQSHPYEDQSATHFDSIEETEHSKRAKKRTLLTFHPYKHFPLAQGISRNLNLFFLPLLNLAATEGVARFPSTACLSRQGDECCR